jgi:hypothetical protein
VTDDRADLWTIVGFVTVGVLLLGLMILIALHEAEERDACRKSGGRPVDDPPVLTGMHCTPTVNGGQSCTPSYNYPWHCAYPERR